MISMHTVAAALLGATCVLASPKPSPDFGPGFGSKQDNMNGDYVMSATPGGTPGWLLRFGGLPEPVLCATRQVGWVGGLPEPVCSPHHTLHLFIWSVSCVVRRASVRRASCVVRRVSCVVCRGLICVYLCRGLICVVAYLCRVRVTLQMNIELEY